MKTLEVIRQMVFDLDLKGKIVVEKKASFSTEKTHFFLLRIEIEIMNGLSR